MRVAAILMALALGCGAASAQTALPAVELPPELKRVLTDYETAWQAKDAPALAKLFAGDRVTMPNACPAAKERAELEKCYAASGSPLSLRAHAFSAEGSSGYIIGEYASTKDAAPAGRFVLTLTKGADGKWLIVADMDQPYRRAPAPQQ